MLEQLKAMGMRLAIVSNCSSEEVKVIRKSRIYGCFDQVILSYETGLQKPDIHIYKKAADLLGVASSECIFVGDGGSNELEGARFKLFVELTSLSWVPLPGFPKFSGCMW